ncbi:MAG: hypothetical protein ACTTIC_06065 [Helicobacteraceae bacterium]
MFIKKICSAFHTAIIACVLLASSAGLSACGHKADPKYTAKAMHYEG